MRAPHPGEFEYYDQETLTVGGGVTLLTPAKASTSFMCRIDVESAEIRYWMSGGIPSPTEGILQGPGAIFYLYLTDMQRFRAVKTFATNAILQVSYGRWPAGKRGTL